MPDIQRDEYGGALAPLDTLAFGINARFEKIDRNETEAANHRIAAGKDLAEARRRVEAGEASEIEWTTWCALNIKRSLRDIRKVMQLAGSSDPQATLEAQRAAAREGMAEMRQRRSNVRPLDESISGPTVPIGGKVDANGRDATQVSIDTVIRDIRLLDPSQRKSVAYFLLPLLSAEEVADWFLEQAFAPPAVQPAPIENVEREAADPPLDPGQTAQTATGLDAVGSSAAPSASTMPAFGGGPVKVTEHRPARSPGSREGWYGNPPPPGVHCSHKGGVCGYAQCAEVEHCMMAGQSQAAA